VWGREGPLGEGPLCVGRDGPLSGGGGGGPAVCGERGSAEWGGGGGPAVCGGEGPLCVGLALISPHRGFSYNPAPAGTAETAGRAESAESAPATAE
jgi:hypothetical protein